jgi:tRNA A-37 threonylcarbamoyl transferase component Bud32/tetratricopeptide (TPR) repeat protein
MVESGTSSKKPFTLSSPTTSAAAKSVLRPGEIVAGRFEVEALADWGGMGAVYRARDRHTGAEVALKLLLDESSEERFAREARVLADLRHPGIVQYVAHGKSDVGALYLAMEWLDGVDLRSRLSTGPLSLRESLALMGAVAEALTAAHARGIVHRDINPRNLFLVGGEPRSVRILDFGIARPMRATFGMTMPGMYLGTPGYMAPEQARGNEEVDARADVFALGCVLYECLTGRAAFVADNLMALLGKVLFEEAPRLRARGDFPAALDDLVAQMMAKDPARRPEDAAAVGAAIAELAAEVIDDPASALPLLDPPSRSITDVEQRLVCVVMASAAPGSGALARDGGTLASAGTDSGRGTSPIARFGARVERLADGSLVATLVGSGDATDHAAHAARFALALREMLPESPIVLATGRGVVTGKFPVGEVLDRAARLLMDSAPPTEPRTGPVRLDEVTAGLLDLRFDVVDDGSHAELRGARESHDVARSVLGRPTTCVGRERDLRTLEATFDECLDESVARVVLVTGPAGLGKTRLRREFLRRVRRRVSEAAGASRATGSPSDDLEVLIGRADPMSAGAPFAMIAQTVTGAAGIADGEPLAARRHKLSALVARHVPEAERARVSEFLGELVGAPFPDEESLQLRAARQDPVLRGDQMRRAYEDWIRAACAHRPVVLVLEDLHWGDLPTVKVVDALLRNLRDARLMVLASARPEVHELFPGAWAQRGVVELRLSELTPKSSERLVREVLGEAASGETVRRIVEVAAGNPFCLEELIRAEADGKRDAPPGSVLAVVSARIDRLDAGARRVLRAASVFGQQFWRGAVVSLVGAQRAPETGRWLDQLAEREVVVKRGRGKFPGEEEYVFRHALVREAAYAMMVGEDRVLGHRLAGAWLEEAGERDALTLAEHFDRGQAPERAVTWYQRAAEQALEGNDLDAALRRCTRAIALGAEGVALAALHEIAAEAHKWRGANADALASAREAMAAAARGGAAWCAALGEMAAASGKLGDRAALAKAAHALLELPAGSAGAAQIVATARAATQLALSGQGDTAEKLLARLGSGAGAAASDPAVAGWVLEARAVTAGSSGDPGARVRLADAAAESFDAAGDLRNACLQRVSVGYAYNEIGAYAEAERALRGALAVAERMGLDNAVGTARAQLGRTLGRLGKLDEARGVLAQAIEALRAQKNVRLAAVATRYLAWVLARQGDLEGAEREARAAAEAQGGVNAMLGDALAMVSEAQRARGATADALGTAKRAMAALEAAGKTAIGEAAIRLAFTEALRATGDDAGAAAALAMAKERLLARAKTLTDSRLRRGFLEDVAEHARTLQLAGG